MLFIFLGTKIANDTAVHGSLVGQYLFRPNEYASVSPLQVLDALKKSPDLVGEACLPQGRVLSFLTRWWYSISSQVLSSMMAPMKWWDASISHVRMGAVKTYPMTASGTVAKVTATGDMRSTVMMQLIM